MKIIKALCLVAMAGFSGHALGATSTYTDQTTFLGNVGSEIFSQNFDAEPNGNANGVFSGQVDFGSPEATNPDEVYFNSGQLSDAGSTIASNAVGPVDGDFLTADSVFAFSLVFSSSGNPQTISIFDLGGGLIDAVLTPAGGFFGLISDDRIGSFLITNGVFSTGGNDRFFIDDFRAYSASAVPVPAAVWLFGTALVGFVGFSRRRRIS